MQEEYYNDIRIEWNDLSRYYPELKIKPLPENFPRNESLHSYHTKYDQYYQKSEIINTVVYYKNFLVVAFLALEYILVKYLKASGFANSQKERMWRYEIYLVQMAKRGYEDGGSGGLTSTWSPEVSLLIFSLTSALLFIMASYGGKYLGIDDPAKLQDMVDNYFFPQNSSKGLEEALSERDEENVKERRINKAPSRNTTKMDSYLPFASGVIDSLANQLDNPHEEE